MEQIIFAANANGDFAFEAEDQRVFDPASGYELRDADDLPVGHEAPSGGGYIVGTADNFRRPVDTPLVYRFETGDEAGFIRVNLLASVADGSPPTDTNDSWTALTTTDGAFLSALPASVELDQIDGYYKTYSSGGQPDQFRLANRNVDNNPQPIVFEVEANTVYEFLLVQRSEGHEVDRILLEFSDDGFPITVANDIDVVRGAPLSEEVVSPPEADDGPNALLGTEDADELRGLGGDDTLGGLGGDDTLYGGEGSDVIEGGAGDDIIVGDDGALVDYGL